MNSAGTTKENAQAFIREQYGLNNEKGLARLLDYFELCMESANEQRKETERYLEAVELLRRSRSRIPLSWNNHLRMLDELLAAHDASERGEEK